MERGYKITNNIDGIKYSYINEYLGAAVAMYDLGVTTLPGSGRGPLCVFTTEYGIGEFIDTELFLNEIETTNNDYGIYECEYEPSSEKTIWARIDKADRNVMSLIGSDTATSVTLTRELSKDEIKEILKSYRRERYIPIMEVLYDS